MNAKNKPGSGEMGIETYSNEELVADSMRILAQYKKEEEEKAAAGRRQEEEKEKIQFEVSPDKTKGYLTLDSGIPTLPTVDMVEDFILDHQVTVPIKRDNIESAFEIYEKDPSRPKRILVAEWTEPERTSARTEYRFLDKAERKKNLDTNLETVILEPYRELASTWPAYYDDYDQFKPPSKMIYVKKGDLLATLIPGIVNPGYDIFGEEIKGDIKGDIPSDEAMEIDRGSIEVREEGKKAYARISGYVTLASPGYTLKIIPPILISKDELQVYFIKFLEQPSLSKEEFQEWLDYFGIKYGILEDNIDSITQGKVENDCMLIAEGIPKEDGEDAKLALYFEDKIKPGEIGEDGRIDFKQRVEYKVFEPGDLIAKQYSLTLGQSGTDVFGRTLLAEDGEEVTVGTLVNVSNKIVEDGVEYFSEITGRAHVKSNKTFIGLTVTHHLHVRHVLSIDGSVDGETGNISFDGDVEIEGDINEGFSVKAGGNIEVNGAISNNATAEAGGDLVVAGGIMGRDTSVQAGSDITTRYINGSHILAGGNITVSRVIHHAHLESGGTIVFLGRRPKDSKALASIVNSRLYAVNGIKAARVGSYADKNTHLTLAPLPIEQLHELNECEAKAQENKKNVEELYSFFGHRPTPKQVTDYLEENPEDSKVKGWLQGMSHFEKEVKPKRKELQELLEENLSGSFRLGLDDILDWPDYCSKLNQDANQDLPSPGKRIWSLLPQEIQSLIQSSATATRLSEEDKSNIINALNDLLEQRNFYQEQDYLRKTLPIEARALLGHQDELSAGDLRKLNRLLIEAAYPHKIAKTNLRGYTPFINVGEMYANVTIEFKPYPLTITRDAKNVTYRMNHRKRTVVSSARSSGSG